MSEERDGFPKGLRVLAVDDNVICLKVLERMLRMCSYHVTTSTEATEALEMLREDRDRFDLIITDVHMPDMDGFKLLEHVGLEMDLPVIMLSANGDTEVVMKGITHGACDYLLKPVRITELKNIWQHVVRKKKTISKENNNSDNATSDDGQGPINSGSSEHKVNRKRKDHNDEDDNDDENMNETENSSNQKRPRVVWSQELHQKFMNAVQQLGETKAVPKRILDLMNVEGLTRENVASHLQKYRLYMKKMRSQGASLAAVLGARDSSVSLAALDSFGDFQSFTSFSQNGRFNRKGPTLFGNNSVSQVSRTHQINPINVLSNINQHGTLFQRMPTTLEVNQLQQQKSMIHEANNNFSRTFTNGISNHSNSIGLPSICSGNFEVNSGISSNLHGDTWQNIIPSTGTSNSLPMSSGFSPVSQIGSSAMSFSSSNTLVANPSHSLIGSTMHMPKGTNEASKYLNFGNVNNNTQQHGPNIVFNPSVNPQFAGQSIGDPTSQNQRLNNEIYSERVVTDMIDQNNFGNLLLPQQCKIDDGMLNFKDDYLLENPMIQGGLSSNGCSFDELANLIKSEAEAPSQFLNGLQG